MESSIKLKWEIKEKQKCVRSGLLYLLLTSFLNPTRDYWATYGNEAESGVKDSSIILTSFCNPIRNWACMIMRENVNKQSSLWIYTYPMLLKFPS